MHERIFQLSLIGLVAIGGTVFFRTHRRGISEESMPAAAASQNAVGVARSSASDGEPVRASVADSREMNLLWKDLDALKQQAHELGPAEYKVHYVRRTATFLQLADHAAAHFAKNIDLALQDFREARERMEKAQAQVVYNPDRRESVMHYRATWDQYSKDRRAAVGRIASTLASTPRC